VRLDTEQELEDYLLEHYALIGDVEVYRDIVTESTWDREFSQLVIGNYGRTDIVRMKYNLKHNYLTIQITELKKGQLDKDALFQICRYKRGFERIFEEYGYDDLSIDFEGVLIGSSVQSGTDFVHAVGQIDWLEMYTFDLSMMEGISFYKKGNYSVVEEGFSNVFIDKVKGLIDDHEDRQENDNKKLAVVK